MIALISFFVVGIIATLWATFRKNQQRAELLQHVSNSPIVQRQETVSVDNSESLADWQEFKRDVLDVYGTPDYCLGPLSIEEVMISEPWNAAPWGSTPLVSITDFMFLYFGKSLAWSLKLYDINDVDHVVIHTAPQPTLIHFYFKGDRQDEIVYDEFDGDAARFSSVLKRFPGLTVETVYPHHSLTN